MAKYRIAATTSGVAIEIGEVAGRGDALLDAFAGCQEGHCSCPTDEYTKVAGMDVLPGPDRIAIRLRAKPGEQFDTDEIAACLDYTVGQTG